MALAVFLLTYLLIAGRRLRWLPIGRPAGALLGAVLMVACGALSPAAAYAAIDAGTISLLLGMMMLGGYLAEDGAFGRLERLLVGRTPWRCLARLSVLSGALSAALVNDTVCVLLTPVALRLCQHRKLPPLPFLLALCTSANLGSAATLVGNPQNMLIGALSGMPFGAFLVRSLPAVILAFLAHLGLLWLYFRRDLGGPLAPAPPEGRTPAPPAGGWLALAVVGAVLVGFVAGLDLAWTTLGGVAALTLLRREEPAAVFARVDWTLLVFFAALFVVVAGLESTGLPERAFAAVSPDLALDTLAGQAWLVSAVVAGSNLISNVPLVMLLGERIGQLVPPELAWVELAYVSTVAGNLTLVGSVANLIVAESARDTYEIGFFEYLRFGAVATALSLAVGAPVLIATALILA